ncbi:MAG: SAM-dependent methyltransferase [Tannerella sp.]|jgi:16S rRNA (cytidine1402-2'-O)-methyltransferase|nr:SAM-dependent methyltransferase [Tannerella sp.]
MTHPALFLIPVTLGDTEHRRSLPAYNLDVIRGIRHFVVENVRSARRFLKKADPSIVIDDLTFCCLNRHTSPLALAGFLEPLARGESVGLISEAGCPAIADPGADVVAIAQQKNYRVTPLAGPSSILMALMASGFNGQRFAFHGYLPVDATARAARIRALEARVYSDDETQIFIETPYRNAALAADLVRLCRPATKLCVAVDITCDGESIRTLAVGDWKGRMPGLNRRPAIFLIYK